MTHFNRWLAGMTVVVSACVAFATPVLAQEPLVANNSPTLLFDAFGGAPTRFTGGATVLFPVGTPSSHERVNAVDIQGSAGMGGVRVAGGMAFLDEGWGPDVLLTMTRTSASPRSADPHATYMGVEAGYNWLIFRMSAGVAHRIAGPSGPDGTVFTWQAGAAIPLCALRGRC